MHAPNAIGVPASKKRVSTYDPDEEAAAALYKNSDGTICVPALVVLGALREAAKEHKAAGKGRRTLKQFVLSGIRVQQEVSTAFQPLPGGCTRELCSRQVQSEGRFFSYAITLFEMKLGVCLYKYSGKKGKGHQFLTFDESGCSG